MILGYDNFWETRFFLECLIFSVFREMLPRFNEQISKCIIRVYINFLFDV